MAWMCASHMATVAASYIKEVTESPNVWRFTWRVPVAAFLETDLDEGGISQRIIVWSLLQWEGHLNVAK